MTSFARADSREFIVLVMLQAPYSPEYITPTQKKKRVYSLYKTSCVAISFHVCVENNKTVENTLGTTNDSQFLYCMTNFFVSKARR